MCDAFCRVQQLTTDLGMNMVYEKGVRLSVTSFVTIDATSLHTTSASVPMEIPYQ